MGLFTLLSRYLLDTFHLFTFAVSTVSKSTIPEMIKLIAWKQCSKKVKRKIVTEPFQNKKPL